jgi:hypothetical protein
MEDNLPVLHFKSILLVTGIPLTQFLNFLYPLTLKHCPFPVSCGNKCYIEWLQWQMKVP